MENVSILSLLCMLFLILASIPKNKIIKIPHNENIINLILSILCFISFILSMTLH